MDSFLKIREVSAKYDITSRTLRYYEDMGLISSVRSDEYAYRMYDETAMTRLEQILILRKLNISIRDIQSIFSAAGSDVVLEVLGKKVQHIDDEVALLHELKDIVLAFIRQIEQMDFSSDSDVRMIYDQAKDIESRLTHVDYIGKPSNMSRLLEVTEQLEKKPDVRLVALPVCRMATSGVKAGDNHERFETMWTRLDAKRTDRFFPRDFMCHDHEMGGPVWYYAIDDWVTEADTEGFEIIGFEGGLYATSIVHDFDVNEVMKAYHGIKEWLTQHHNFTYDERPGHPVMFHVTSPDTYRLLGYRQVEYFFPVKAVSQFA